MESPRYRYIQRKQSLSVEMRLVSMDDVQQLPIHQVFAPVRWKSVDEYNDDPNVGRLAGGVIEPRLTLKKPMIIKVSMYMRVVTLLFELTRFFQSILSFKPN